MTPMPWDSSGDPIRRDPIRRARVEDDRRDEIEAVARVARKVVEEVDKIAPIPDALPDSLAAALQRLAGEVRNLDRVRDARDDDEASGRCEVCADAPYPWNYADALDYLEQRRVEAARSPQGEDHEAQFRFQLPSPSLEDHEAGIEAAMRASYDRWPQSKDGKPKTYEECYGCAPLDNKDDRAEMEVAIAAYLSRVAPARPEQPPPDTLGGQPPAEPPEAP